MTSSPVPSSPPRWLASTEHRRFLGRAIFALLLTLFMLAIVPLSVRLTQRAGDRDPSAVTPELRAQIDKEEANLRYAEIGILMFGVFGFAIYEGGGFVMGLVVGLIDDAFAGRRTQPRTAVRDDSDV